MSAPLEFKPGVFYPFDHLEKQLAGVMTVKTFLMGLGLDCTGRNRTFQNGVMGDEILEAMKNAARKPKATPASQPHVDRVRKRGRPSEQQGNDFRPVTRKDLLD